MNEININIPYSFFKDMFIAWFATQIRSGFTQAAERAMLKAQEHWILFDTDLRKDVVSIAKEVAHVRPYQPFTDDFDDNWIKCSDRLPPVNKDGESCSVLLYGMDILSDFGSHQFIGYLMDGKFYCDDGHSPHQCYYVSHWQPLPPPPTE